MYQCYSLKVVLIRCFSLSSFDVYSLSITLLSEFLFHSVKLSTLKKTYVSFSLCFVFFLDICLIVLSLQSGYAIITYFSLFKTTRFKISRWFTLITIVKWNRPVILVSRCKIVCSVFF